MTDDKRTLQQVKDEILAENAVKGLAAIASVRALTVSFVWERSSPPDRVVCDLDMTLGSFKSPPPCWRYFIVLDDGRGGMPSDAPAPVLEDA